LANKNTAAISISLKS